MSFSIRLTTEEKILQKAMHEFTQYLSVKPSSKPSFEKIEDEYDLTVAQEALR